MRMCSGILGRVEGRGVNGAEPGAGAAPGVNQATEAEGGSCFRFSPTVLPQDSGPAAAPGLHPAEEEPLCRNHRAAPGQPAGGGPGSAGALSRARGLQLGAALRAQTGLLCVSVGLFVLGGGVASLSKGFLRNALLPAAGCTAGPGRGAGLRG